MTPVSNLGFKRSGEIMIAEHSTLPLREFEAWSQRPPCDILSGNFEAERSKHFRCGSVQNRAFDFWRWKGGWLEGKGAVVSEERKVDILLKFHTDYEGEQFISDGDKSYIAARRVDHRRTSFGEFVKSQSLLLQEGLLGGALSTGWTLLNLDHANPKLSYGGLKKVDGRQLMVLHYESKKGNDMNIRLYFDPETYQHVMTVYELTAAAGLGALPNRPGAEPTQSSRQRDIRYTLEERFSNFTTTDGITLPAHYNIHFIEELQNGRTGLYEWDMTMNEVQDNLTLDPRNFQIH